MIHKLTTWIETKAFTLRKCGEYKYRPVSPKARRFLTRTKLGRWLDRRWTRRLYDRIRCDHTPSKEAVVKALDLERKERQRIVEKYA